MSRFLVTGGCGFIGSHLVEALLQAGHHVRVLDNLSSGQVICMKRYENLITEQTAERISLITGDVADPAVVARAFDGMDGCFHLAAVASVERGNLDWVGSHRTNVTGAVTVFDAARKDHVPVVYASSAAVYGDNPDVLEETQPPHPLSAYGADKYGCELHGFVASHVHGVPNCGLRFFNVYGPRQDPRSPYSGVITIFGTRLRTGQTMTINGDGYHTRDFIYVHDVVRALRLGMEHCAKTENGSDVFNVCTGIETTVIDLAGALGMVFRRPPVIKHGPPRPGDPRRSIGCPERARRVLGFTAATDLNTGLAATFTTPGLV